jgi:hypothetical protein
MRYLRIFTVFGLVLCAASFAHAQRVVVGVGIGAPGPIVAGPPVCAYGYYSYAPYACAPYGYYGPEWFSGGLFIGAGPWFHGFYGHSGFYGRPGWGGHGFVGRPGFGHGPVVRGPVGGFHGGAVGGFHGGAVAHGGGSFHGGGGFHGSGGRR